MSFFTEANLSNSIELLPKFIYASGNWFNFRYRSKVLEREYILHFKYCNSFICSEREHQHYIQRLKKVLSSQRTLLNVAFFLPQLCYRYVQICYLTASHIYRSFMRRPCARSANWTSMTACEPTSRPWLGALRPGPPSSTDASWRRPFHSTQSTKCVETRTPTNQGWKSTCSERHLTMLKIRICPSE